MSIAKAFYQCHILRFLSSHLVQLPYHRSLSYQSAYNRRHARPCLSSMYGCIRRGTVSVYIENYWQTERQSPPVMCGKLSWVPSKLTLQQAAKLPESLLRHFLSHPLLSDVDVRRLVDTGSVDEDAYTSMLLWFLAAGGDGHRLIFGGCDEVGAYMELTLWHNTAHAESFQFYLSDYPCPGYAE